METDQQNLLNWLEGQAHLNHPQVLFNCIMEMEGSEYWTLDLEKINDLTSLIEDSPDTKQIILPQEIPEFLKVLAYNKCGSAFRLLSSVHKKQPDLLKNLLIVCANESLEDAKQEVRLFIARLKKFVKRECFYELFGRENRRIVIEVTKRLYKINQEAL